MFNNKYSMFYEANTLGLKVAMRMTAIALAFEITAHFLTPSMTLNSLFSLGATTLASNLLMVAGFAVCTGFAIGALYRWSIPMLNLIPFPQRFRYRKADTSAAYSHDTSFKPQYEVSDRQVVLWAPPLININYSQASQEPHSASSSFTRAGRIFSEVVYQAKALSVAFIPRKTLISIARWLPFARGMFEYTNVNKFNMDDLQYFIDQNMEAEALEIIKLLPNASLNRMLSRKDTVGYTSLYDACSGNSSIFDALLAALTPSQRWQHIHYICGYESIRQKSVLSRIFAFHRGKDSFAISWKILQKYFPNNILLALLWSADHRGDNAFITSFIYNNQPAIKTLLPILASHEVIKLFTHVCPHGHSPILSYVSKNKQKESIHFLKHCRLSKSELSAVFAHKPSNWTMSIGEKIVVMAYVNHYDKHKEKGSPLLAKYLSKEFSLALPEAFKDLTDAEFKSAMTKLQMYHSRADCEELHQFKEKYGSTPEDLLGAEPLLPPKAYTSAYRRLQRQYHPDRNQSIFAPEVCRKLNAANEFIASMQRPRKRSYKYKYRGM